ncbi:hypothetical protein C2I18_04935 [Paenibacillus sp. PK3_47]|uniref:S8 family serine peptidase n=1 Tax=Paenibacillus sp. PK3_47 TaxID=2072642 RepID=UPI00201DED34|nr:S8 family serine peptidase [Paenibacillus sp. PK3_47]UQZ32963.1 hypothetical protein C2I18_04935 [Paenibacillus sp. PK3_47]
MYKRSIRKIGISAASFSLAVSLIFPSATSANAGNFLPPSPNLKNHTSLLNSRLDTTTDSLKQFNLHATSTAIKPQNYAGTSNSSAPLTVIVQLQNDPVKVVESQADNKKGFSPSLQRNLLRAEHNTFKSAASRLGAVTGHEYTEVFNGYAVTLPGNQVDKLLALPGVKAIFSNQTVHALETEAPPSSGGSVQEIVGNGDIFNADKLNDAGIRGDGIKVAVIDTGIDHKHSYLADSYKGGYDVVDDDTDPYETEPDPQYLPIDGNPYETSHGSHVSGIIKSVAPDADIYAYRVLGPYGTGTTADVIKGIELAVSNEDKIDVINLSLGTDVNQQYSPDAIAVDNAAKAGVTVVLAAGNAGPEAQTVGTPGGAHRTISVGASTTPAYVNIFKVGEVDNIYGILGAGSEELPSSAIGQEVVYAGLGSPEDFAKVDVKGKVALVDRGTYTFVSKSANAANAGAIGLLIANNTLGELNLAVDASGVPTYGITKEDGTLIKQTLEAGSSTLDFDIIFDTKNWLAGFSSRGPALPDFTIKPDVLAPGVGINSSVPEWESATGYARINGTSMASPHVAGAAALLLDINPDLTPDQVKVLLSNNATSLVDRKGKFYSLHEQGAGLIDLSKVVNANSIARVSELLDTGRPDIPVESYDTGSLSYGLQTNLPATVSKTVYVDALTSNAKQYSVSVEWRTDHEGITLPSFSDVTAGNYFEVPLTVNANVKAGIYEAILTLTEAGSVSPETLTLPLSVAVGEELRPDTVTDLYVGNDVISPNGDDYLDYTDFSFSVHEPVDSLRMEVADLYTGTVVGDVYATGEKYYRGMYETLEWDGTVFTQGSKDKVHLQDGIYTITPVLNDTTSLDDQSIMFIVDTEAPVVSGLTITEQSQVEEEGQRTAVVSGYIAYDLLLELRAFGEDLNDWLGVAAVFEGIDGEPLQSDGFIDESGYFEIEVPLNDGLNQFYIYAYDFGGNGEAEYAQLLRYDTDVTSYTVAPSASNLEAYVGQPVTIDVGFSVTDNVYGIYGATFNLLYDNKMGAPSITSSVQLATYQEANFPGEVLPEFTNLIHLDEEVDVLQYGVHLTDGAYTESGTGSLGKFTFTPTTEGTYTFTLSDVLLWSDAYSATVPAGLSTVNVIVKKPVPTIPTNPTGPTGSSSPVSSLNNSTVLAAGQLTETTDPAGGKPSAVLAISEAALTASLEKASDTAASLDLTDVEFSKYSKVSIKLTAAQAEKLKTTGKALGLAGKGFALLIPAATLSDFITVNGIDMSIGLAEGADIASLAGSAALVDIGSSLLTIKNGWTSGKPLTVILTLNDDGQKDVRKTAAYQHTADGKVSYLQAGTLSENGVLQFIVTGDGTYSAAALHNTGFKDTALHWAKDDIEVLAAHGIIAGKGTDGSFKPSDSLNRAELLTLFDRLLGKGDTWTSRIKETGAREVLTREEAVLIVTAALKADTAGAIGSLNFKDTPKISESARNAVAFVVSKGYFKGEGANTFNPGGTLTRAQAAVILHRVFEDLRSN